MCIPALLINSCGHQILETAERTCWITSSFIAWWGPDHARYLFRWLPRPAARASTKLCDVVEFEQDLRIHICVPPPNTKVTDERANIWTTELCIHLPHHLIAKANLNRSVIGILWALNIMSHQQICWHGRVESLLRYNYQVLSLGNCMMKLSTKAGLMAIIPRAFGSAGT